MKDKLDRHARIREIVDRAHNNDGLFATKRGKKYNSKTLNKFLRISWHLSGLTGSLTASIIRKSVVTIVQQTCQDPRVLNAVADNIGHTLKTAELAYNGNQVARYKLIFHESYDPLTKKRTMGANAIKNAVFSESRYEKRIKTF